MSFRCLLALAVICAVAGWSVEAHAQSVGGVVGLKENLDLPFDAIGEEGSEEDAPEVVMFYGQSLEGDGFFYTVDRSGSMQDSGELGIAKREISRNITEFSNRTQFGVSFFDANLIKFPSSGRPVEASAGMKSAGLAWINGVPGGTGSCCQKGLLCAIQFANFSSVRRKVIVYVGDGGGTGPCGGAGGEQQYLNATLQRVSQMNYQRATVNTIGVLMNGRPTQETFLKALASQNGGTYKRIN